MNDLDYLMDVIRVEYRYDFKSEATLSRWPDHLPYAVTDERADPVALFRTNAAANQYRLMIIAARANPNWEASPEEYDRCDHGMFYSGAGACPQCGGGAE